MVKKPTLEKRVSILEKTSKAQQKVIASQGKYIELLLQDRESETIAKPIEKTSTTTVSKTVNEYPHLVQALDKLKTRKGRISMTANNNVKLILPYVGQGESWTELKQFMSNHKVDYFQPASAFIYKGKELPIKVTKFLEAQKIQLDKV